MCMYRPPAVTPLEFPAKVTDLPMRSMSSTCLLFAAAIGVAVIAGTTGARAACDGKEVLFADDFSAPVLSALSWRADGGTAFRNKKYVFTLDPNSSVRNWPADKLFAGSYSICAQVKLPSDPQGPAGSGLAFWINPAKNKIGENDHYMAAISPDGYYWVAKFVDGVQTPVVDDVKRRLVKTGPNDVNELSVTIRGNTGTFSLNGSEVGTFTGQPPAQSHAGVTAGSPPGIKYVIEFSNFRVLRP